jgi:flagellar biosynthetic protein FlhB
LAEESDREDRTEAASARRLQKAREEGQVPLSRECVTLAGLATATLAFCYAVPSATREVARLLAGLLAQAHALDPADGGADIAAIGLHALAVGAGPFVLAALLGGVGAVLLQTGFLIHPGALAPKLGALDPRAGLKRLFGTSGLMEGLKSLAKLAVIGWAVWLAVGADWRALGGATLFSPPVLLDRLMRLLLHMALAVLGAQAAIALADLAWVRHRHAASLRMSRHDLREEQREAEGDPRIKARIRQIRGLRARKRMMAAVPKAAVVITNPTHYAVALAYDRGRHAAPKVVAKGVDSMALRIRAIARAANVPVVADPPLARALHRVELEAEIPGEHFKAVAEILAYIWGLNRRAGQAAATGPVR